MGVSLSAIRRILSRSADAGDHIVVINGEKSGTCTQASFRVIAYIGGFEVIAKYAYELDGVEHLIETRTSAKNIGKGGREQIKFDGQDVTEDDLLVGADDSSGEPSLYVEFVFKPTNGELTRLKFAAPVSAFN